MTPVLDTREVAVKWLKDQGLHAVLRDWSFGASIIASAGQQVLKEGEQPVQTPTGEPMVVYRHMLCIYPDREGWSVAWLSGGGMPNTRTYPDLTEASKTSASLLLEKLSSEGCKGDA